MKVAELFQRCKEMATAEPTAAARHYLHQTLVLACGEVLHDSGQAFGNLFAQVDYLSKRHSLPMRERIAIQPARRHSNGHETLTVDDWRYDVRATAVFTATIFGEPMPADLQALLPARSRQQMTTAAVNLQCLRCIVTGWDHDHIYATTDNGPISVGVTDPSLPDILATGMQLNLLDCHQEGTTIEAGLIVVEPDFLIDISAVAACFQDYGHHPMSYLVSRMKPRANSQQILLGNFAGTALDDQIHQPTATVADSLRTSFREQVLSFCCSEPFDAQQFKTDARQQVENIREAVNVLFEQTGTEGYNRQRALLEPSFVCERLGLQGRVDLMTDDMRLLVEQKSGKNWNIEHPQPGQKGLQKEDHYVQLLLYYGVLRYNFNLSADRVDIRLLYSKYPARQGLLVVNYYQKLFREVISLRNRIVAQEIRIAREGFSNIMPLLRPSILLENTQRTVFFNSYIRGDVERVMQPLHQLSAIERDYVERLLTFVYREQLALKIGVQEGVSRSVADLWNMPLSEKIETGSILLGRLRAHTTDTVTITTNDSDTTLPDFRRGDMVYLYRYEGEPDVRKNILYKGVIEHLGDDEATIRLNEAQHHPQAFSDGSYAVEHTSSDIGTASAIRSIHAFCTASQDKRDLLLGRRPPRRDSSQQLLRSYHAHYDDILLKAKQARDYFVLQGPPGTGKTSMALRFLVEEELTSDIRHQTSDIKHQTSGILLTAYTNRAVDEICGMLEEAGLDYLRIGNEASCDPRYANHLLERMMDERPKMEQIRQQITDARIIVSTTSTLQARPFILQLKQFSLCVVDEASQILEPAIIGILASDSIERFILIGDHKQLPAVVQQPDDEPALHDCRLSLFERLLHQEQQAGRTDFTAVLRRQGRMHPDIAAFPNEMFYAREHLECVPLPHQEEAELDYRQPSSDALDNLLKQHRVLFFPDDIQPSTINIQHSDKANASEARLVADLLRRIYRQVGADHFDANRTVGVIVPYRNQIAMIRREIAALGIPALLDISIDTVERYQGSQRDVIIYSFTISKPYQLDFLTANCFEEDDGEYQSSDGEYQSSDGAHQSPGHVIDRKLNVAMTRARKQLLMTGNQQVLCQNPIFAKLIQRYSVNAQKKRTVLSTTES